MAGDETRRDLAGCTCTPPPGKNNAGRQRRHNKHDRACELVVYVEKLEAIAAGVNDLAALVAELETPTD